MATLYIPPVFHAVLTPMTELVTTGCTMCTIDTAFSSSSFKLKQRVVEVEARLGRQSETGFVAGVTPAMFDTVVTKLESFKAWAFCSAEWETVHDYLYSVDGHVVRTRKVFVPEVPVEHVIKKRLKNMDVCCSSNKPPPPLLNTLDIRGSLSLEQHVEFPEDFVVQPEQVFRKQQKRFQYKNWMFVLSKSLDGSELHVEVEALELQTAIGSVDKQQYIALGLLMKLVDFYPPLDGPYMLLPSNK
jgi:hypothetical protein